MDGRRGIRESGSTSREETLEVAREFAQGLVPGDVICLHGDLGVGKTTFTKGLVEVLAPGTHQDEVTSPTFVTLNLYQHVAHFDLYRLERLVDFTRCGFAEYLEEPYITIIEWPKLIESLLPRSTYHIEIKRTGENSRVFVV